MQGEDLRLSLMPGSSSVEQEQGQLALERTGPDSALPTGAGASARARDVSRLTDGLTLGQRQDCLNISVLPAVYQNLG